MVVITALLLYRTPPDSENVLLFLTGLNIPPYSWISSDLNTLTPLCNYVSCYSAFVSLPQLLNNML